jgi:hypothetical protein
MSILQGIILGRATADSPFQCEECGGSTKFIVPASRRNVLLGVTHLSYFCAGIALVFHGGTGINDVVLFVLLFGGLAVFQRFYETQLLCNSCEHRGEQ